MNSEAAMTAPVDPGTDEGVGLSLLVKAQADGNGGFRLATKNGGRRLARQHPVRGVDDAQAVLWKVLMKGELGLEGSAIPHQEDLDVRLGILESTESSGHLSSRGPIGAHGVQGNPHLA